MTSPDIAFWDHQALRIAPTAHSLTVGGKAVLFDDVSQNLFQQNDSSAAIWQAVAAEGSLAGAARTLAASEDEYGLILQYARSAGLQWLRSGLLRPVELDDGASSTLFTLGWAGCRVGLEVHGGIDTAPLQEVFRDVLSAEPPAHTLRVRQIGDLVFIAGDQGQICARAESEWIPELKAQFTAKILGDVTTGFLVHAALLSRSGRGLLVCGAPGAGKTTLSVSLALARFDYHSDDIVQVAETGEVSGAPFAPALKEGAWPIVEQMTGAALTAPVYLRSDGQAVRYLSLPSVNPEPVKLDAILLLARDASGPARIEAVEPLEVLTTILASAYSAKGALSPDGLKSLVATIEQAKLGRLCCSEWTEARALIDSFTP